MKRNSLISIILNSTHKKHGICFLDGFYKTTLRATPTAAHIALVKLEGERVLKSIITQNIDNLHTKAE